MGICCELCEAYLDADIDDSAGVAFAAGWRQSWDGWLCPLCAAAWAHPASDPPLVALASIPTRIEPDPDWPEWRRALWWLGGIFEICRWTGCSRAWPELERCHSCDRHLPLEDERWPT